MASGIIDAVQELSQEITRLSASNSAIIRKLNEVGYAVPAKTRLHEIAGYINVTSENTVNAPLGYSSIGGFVSYLPSGKNELIDAISVAGCWDGSDRDTCKVSEISAHIVYGKYIVTFDANGGECEEKTRAVPRGECIGTLPIPTKEGYVYVGWFNSKEGGTQILSNTVPVSNITCYAQYMAKYLYLNKVGNVIVQQNQDGDWIASGFAGGTSGTSDPGSYLISDTNSTLNFADGLELVFYASTSNPSVNQEVFGMVKAEAFEFGAYKNKFMWEIAGGSIVCGSATCQKNTWYYYKVVKQKGSTTYICSYGIIQNDGTIKWTQDYAGSHVNSVNGQFAVGIDYWCGSEAIHGEAWQGEINISKSYISINDEIIRFKVNGIVS